MKTENWKERTGLASYCASILAFWTVAFALGGIVELDGGGPFGLIVAGVLGALLFGGPFFIVEICESSPSSERFWANAGRVFGAGFVGALAAVAGFYWAAPLFFVVWFAVKRKTTALGPTLRRFPRRILIALVATAALCGATGAILGNGDPSAGAPNGYFALLTALAVFYATAALAFALVAFKTANVDAETTCVNDDGDGESAAVEAKEPREIGLGFYFAAVSAFLALALSLRFEGNFLSVWLLLNAPFFCVTLCDRRLWRAWPLSLVATVFIPVLALGSVWASAAFLNASLIAFGLGVARESLNVLIACVAALTGACVAASLFGVWLASTLKTAPGETLARRRGRILTAVGIFALVETALYVGGAIGEEHYFCSLGVAFFETPTLVLHWSALGVLAFWARCRNDDAGKNEPRDWGKFYRRISDNVGGGRAETLGTAASE